MKPNILFLILSYILLLFAINTVQCNNFRRQNENKLLKSLYRILKSLDDSIQPVKDETIPLNAQDIDKLLNTIPQVDSICIESEQCARNWMNQYNHVLDKLNERGSFLEYQFSVNITDENEKEVNDYAPLSNRFSELTLSTAKEFLKHCDSWEPDLRRMLFLASQGILFKNQEDVKNNSALSNKLESIYATAKVCKEKSNKCLSLEPELTEILKSSRDYNELIWAWKGWHDASGAKMRSIYTQTVELNNKGARENGYADLSERWIEDFEDSEFEKNYDELFNKIKPLYEQLHAYIRRKLNDLYGSHYPKSHNPQLIPAHLLGNMWAQTWDNIYDLVIPFPNVKQMNFTEVLIEKKLTVTDMFKQSENFFVSLGMDKMTPAFWKNSMIVKPNDREVVCHASASDFFNGFDFRIKMCTVVNEDNFFVVHHEMGHIEYYMMYKDQPAIFKTGANSAFHEAIGDTISLSVQTPKHFKSIGILDDDNMSSEQEINYLMLMALKKLSFLPFGYLMDKWRWNVFRGVVNESNYNQKWWEMRKAFQGLEPPVERSENDFDPGAKYHTASYTPYARYFYSHFLQFQFYRALCQLAGHEGPLHRCDFYKSQNAGEKLRNMLELGASKHWTFALNLLTNETSVSADAVFEYFKPLEEWLIKENSKFSDVKVGF